MIDIYSSDKLSVPILYYPALCYPVLFLQNKFLLVGVVNPDIISLPFL